MGCRIASDGTTLHIEGVGAERLGRCSKIETGESGLLTRLLTPLASHISALNGGAPVEISGHGSILKRNLHEAVAALRELREETGWQAQRVEEIIRFNPSYGSSDQLFITWLATGLRWVGMDADQDEVMETGWFTFDEINQLIARGEMPDGLSLVPLLQLMAQRRSGPLTA